MDSSLSLACLIQVIQSSNKMDQSLSSFSLLHQHRPSPRPPTTASAPLASHRWHSPCSSDGCKHATKCCSSSWVKRNPTICPVPVTRELERSDSLTIHGPFSLRKWCPVPRPRPLTIHFQRVLWLLFVSRCSPIFTPNECNNDCMLILTDG